jgi:hypothetical protein
MKHYEERESNFVSLSTVLVINFSGTSVSENRSTLFEVQKIQESLEKLKARGDFRYFRFAALIAATVKGKCDVQYIHSLSNIFLC